MKPSIYPSESIRNDYLCLFRNRVRVHLSEIILLEAQENYTHLYLQNEKKITIARTLKTFETILENYNFHRIHRTFLVNAKHIRSYNFILGMASLTDNYKIVASRRRKINFEDRLFPSSKPTI